MCPDVLGDAKFYEFLLNADRDLCELLTPVSIRVISPAGSDGQDARASPGLGRSALLAA